MIAVQGIRHGKGTAVPPRNSLRLLLGFGVLAMLGFSACALDKEGAVRAQLDGWIVLGDTLSFSSTRDCTAALFKTGSTGVLSGASKTRSVDRGLRLIGQGATVAFDIAGMSPADIQSAIDADDRAVGLAILASGLAARDCYVDDHKDAFSQALFTNGVMLIFDPQNSAVALFDRTQKQVFYTRAEL